ncbi:ribonuclease H-like domain-containing protein [Tanacetum coccineum]
MSGEEPATQIAPVESPQMVSTVKLPILKKGEYTLWSMRMEQYLTNTDYSLWQVILNGDGPIQVTTDEKGVETEVPPKTAQALLQRQRERKAKSILLLAIPDEYQLRFHGIKDAKSLWAAIKSRFGGNVESKKMQKSQIDAAKVTVNEPKTPDGACYLELKVPSRSRRDGCWNFVDRYGYRYADAIGHPLLPLEMLIIHKKIHHASKKRLAGIGCFIQEGYVMQHQDASHGIAVVVSVNLFLNLTTFLTPCKYHGKNIAFHVNEGSTNYWLSLLVEFEDGDGDVGSMHIRELRFVDTMKRKKVTKSDGNISDDVADCNEQKLSTDGYFASSTGMNQRPFAPGLENTHLTRNVRPRLSIADLDIRASTTIDGTSTVSRIFNRLRNISTSSLQNPDEVSQNVTLQPPFRTGAGTVGPNDNPL